MSEASRPGQRAGMSAVRRANSERQEAVWADAANRTALRAALRHARLRQLRAKGLPDHVPLKTYDDLRRRGIPPAAAIALLRGTDA